MKQAQKVEIAAKIREAVKAALEQNQSTRIEVTEIAGAPLQTMVKVWFPEGAPPTYLTLKLSEMI